MDEWIEIEKDTAHVARERAKARELRASGWWKAQLARGVCHYCGNHFEPDELTMDHIIPVARGGRSVKGNVVACCEACNRQKRYLTPAEQILEALEREGSLTDDSEAMNVEDDEE